MFMFSREKLIASLSLQMSYLSSEASCEFKRMDPVSKSSSKSSATTPCDPKNINRVAKSSVNSNHKSSTSRSNNQTSKSSANFASIPTCEPKNLEPLTKTGANPLSNSRRMPSPRMLADTEFPLVSTTATTGVTAAAPVGTHVSDAKSSSSFANHFRVSGSSSRSNSIESSTAPLKPHTGGDVRWDAINMVNSKDPPIGLNHFRLLKRLGYGDIGSVYLVELGGTNTYFAMKVMDKASLASRNKLLRAQTEREILGLLDHPFLPTLYSYFETDKFYCLVMEFCSGGNLHSLRQKQPNKYFTEEAARSVLFHGYDHFLL